MYLPEYTHCCPEDGHDWQKHVGTNFGIFKYYFTVFYNILCKVLLISCHEGTQKEQRYSTKQSQPQR
jgi:hypothetical protein